MRTKAVDGDVVENLWDIPQFEEPCDDRASVVKEHFGCDVAKAAEEAAIEVREKWTIAYFHLEVIIHVLTLLYQASELELFKLRNGLKWSWTDLGPLFENLDVYLRLLRQLGVDYEPKGKDAANYRRDCRAGNLRLLTEASVAFSQSILACQLRQSEEKLDEGVWQVAQIQAMKVCRALYECATLNEAPF